MRNITKSTGKTSSKLTVFFLFLMCGFLSAQNHHFLLIDETEKLVPNLSVFINNNVYKSDKKGEIDYIGKINEIKIDENDYYFYEQNIEKDGLYKIVLSKTKIQEIETVNLVRKDSVINPYKPRRAGFSFACRSTTTNLSLLNRFSINKKVKVKSYSFFIMTDKKYNVPFNFVIYKKSDNNKLKKIHTILISNYLENENTFDLSYKNIFLEPGEYFFGMEWIINEEAQKTIRLWWKKEEYYLIAQALGGSMRKKPTNKTYFYTEKEELINLPEKSFQQIKISL